MPKQSLAEQTQIVTQPEELDAAAVDAFWKWQQKGSVILEAEQYGWISLLQRPRARKLVGTMIEIGQGKGRVLCNRLAGGLPRAWKA